MSDKQKLFQEWHDLRVAVDRSLASLQAARELQHTELITAMETNHRAALLAYSSVVERLNA